MKTVSLAMENHLKEGATTLTTCWKIMRTDGREFFYTELDEDITFEGDTYKSAAGFNKSAITSSATFAVDKLEVTGFLRDDGITDEEIRNGAFDYARVEVFMINYEDLGAGKIKLRAGWFGEVRTTGSGAFMVELRGLVDQLQVKIGDTYLPECRVDLGSPKCGIKLTPDLRAGGTAYELGQRMIWPVADSDYIPDRHFPELLDPNNTALWNANARRRGDINCSPVIGPIMLGFSVGPTSGTLRYQQVINFSDIGLTPEMIASGLYKVTFSSKYYRLSSAASGGIRIACQEQYFNTGIYTDIVTNDYVIGAVPPKRRWVQVEASIDIHPDTDRFMVSVYATPDPRGNSRSALCWDDLDFFISYRADQVASFAAYGGVEFECIQKGKTATAAPIFTGTVGDEVTDGGVIWRVVDPKYTHLRTLTANMTATNRLTVDPVPEEWPNFFDWGVVKFLTGENAGRAMEIADYNVTTGVIKLALPLPYRGMTGDLISIQAGCNKTLKVCELFENVINFRGHPRVPGQGQYFKVAGS